MKNPPAEPTQALSGGLVGATNGGETKIKNMYFAYNQLNEYLYVLIENNLIEYFDGNNKLKTTEKGVALS